MFALSPGVMTSFTTLAGTHPGPATLARQSWYAAKRIVLCCQPDADHAMISSSPLDDQSLSAWRDTTNRAEIDPDSDLTDLVPVLSRLLGWLCEPETCERRGMRVTALVQVVRPDLNGGRSLGKLSPTSKQNFSKLVVDFRSTFGFRASAHQIAKNGKVLATNGLVAASNDVDCCLTSSDIN
jgi:hypothetical protein